MGTEKENEYIEKFHDLLQEYRRQYHLRFHKKATLKETFIEVKSGEYLVVHVTEESHADAYRRAYEDLDLYIRTRTERTRTIIDEFWRTWDEMAE